MEFPSLCQQCTLESCKQIDFLPLTCVNCQQIFCKEHFITSAHDCKCLNEFFKKPIVGTPSEFYSCNMRECTEKSPIQLSCRYCNLHFCVSHRHHGCKDDLMNSERKKLQVEQWKKPKEQFKVAKAVADKKIEQTLRKAETTQLQPLAQKIRLMKIKGKASGDNKIPTDHRIYFSVHPPITSENLDYKPVPLYTSIQSTVGRTIDLFSKKMKLINKNNEAKEPKLRIFKLSDGSLISKTTDTVMKTVLESSICNGDSLILNYVDDDSLKNDCCSIISADHLEKYKQAAIE